MGWYLRKIIKVPVADLEEAHWPWEIEVDIGIPRKVLRQIVKVNDSSKIDDEERERQLKGIFRRQDPAIHLIFKE